MKYILKIVENDKEIEMLYISKKNPEIIYKDTTYNAYMPGSIIKTDNFTISSPLPKGICGFVVDDYIIFITKGISPHVRITNKRCEARILRTKKNKIMFSIITVLFFILCVALFLLFYLL